MEMDDFHKNAVKTTNYIISQTTHYKILYFHWRYWDDGGVLKYARKEFKNFVPSADYYKANQDKQD